MQKRKLNKCRKVFYNDWEADLIYQPNEIMRFWNRGQAICEIPRLSPILLLAMVQRMGAGH